MPITSVRRRLDAGEGIDPIDLQAGWMQDHWIGDRGAGAEESGNAPGEILGDGDET